jgi:hypothetical protein
MCHLVLIDDDQNVTRPGLAISLQVAKHDDGVT